MENPPLYIRPGIASLCLENLAEFTDSLLLRRERRALELSIVPDTTPTGEQDVHAFAFLMNDLLMY